MNQYSQEFNMKAQVIQSMIAQLDEEIDLFEGEIVTITNIIDDTWYRGFINERIGIFPSSHVELLQPYSNSHIQALDTSCTANPQKNTSISSREIFKQCVESTALELEPSFSPHRIYEQSVDSSTSELGSHGDFENQEFTNVESYPHSFLETVPQGITLYPFCAQFDNELSFQAGQIVNLIRYIDKYWMEGEIDGKKGILPANYLNIIVDCIETMTNETLTDHSEVSVPHNISVNSPAMVMFNFDAQMSGDLCVKEGETVFVVGLSNNDWCQVQNNFRQVGLVPCVYLSQVGDETCQVHCENGNSVEINEQNSGVIASKCEIGTDNTVSVSSRSTQAHKLSSDNVDLDKAMLRNLAELSLSGQQGDNCKVVEKLDSKTNKSHRSITMEVATLDEASTRTSAEDTHPKYDGLLMRECGDIEMRKYGGKDNAKPSAFHKRESIDRVPHRPAPPVPVLLHQACHEHIETVVHAVPGAYKSQLDVRPDLEKTENHEAEDERKKNLEQRQNVIAELVCTEKEFSRDLKITYETFNLHNPSFLESYGVDVKLLFGNFLEVIHLSEDFTDQLLLALKGKSEESQCVGPCFLNMASQMKSVYSEYTVNHDSVLSLLEKYDLDPAIKRVLDKGVETLRYQISCFDMGSILIKPVQRVLKYPLIVNELIKYTEDDHEDKSYLMKAVLAMMDVANDINENKRRKDIVVKYLEDNPTTISSRISRITLHSVAKKSTRIGALLSSSLGMKTGARDDLYDEQENLFYILDKIVRSFLKNTETFVSSLQEIFCIKCLIAENIVCLYDDDTTFEVDKYFKIVKIISSQFLNEFKRTVDSRVSVPLTMLLECFEGPWKLVQKRYDKLLDYEAFYSKLDKSKENKQGMMTIMKNTFTALNDQLLEELPVLVSLSCEVFAECVKAFVLARKLFMGKVTKQYLLLFSEISEGNTHYDEPVDQFLTKNSVAWSQLINSLTFIKQPKLDSGLAGMPMNLTSSTRSISPARSAATFTQSSSQQAFLQSCYHLNKLYHIVENYSSKECMELTVREGELVAVIKKQNPMGDPKIWFVDNGETRGFVPSCCLSPVKNVLTGQSLADEPDHPSINTCGAVLHKFSETPSKPDSPPPYDSVVSADTDGATGHLYEEIKEDDKLFYVSHDLSSNAEHILHVHRGQIVKVLHKEDYDGNPEWWFIEDEFKNTGYVPANYLSKHD